MDRLLTRRRFGMLASASLVGLAGCESPEEEGGDGDDGGGGDEGGEDDEEGGGGYSSDGAAGRTGPTHR